MSPLWIVLTLLPIIGAAERFNCRGRILGAYYADGKSGCKAFHVCVRVAGGGIRDFRFFCPPGTLFHQEAQTCTDWGDDDPLVACPVDLYDGQFDLYRIGSGFDTKKVSSSARRDEEAEFGLQRAETGDRRLSQNSASNSANSDLRTAHSSDFFSGQRERGRDETAQPTPQPSSPQSSPPQKSFRRPQTTRTPQPTTQYTPTVPTTTPPQAHSHNDHTSKRKLVRKRPIYVTAAPTTVTQQNTSPQPVPPQPQQNTDRRGFSHSAKLTTQSISIPPHFKDYKDEYVEVSRVTPKPKVFSSKIHSVPISKTTSTPNYSKKQELVELYNNNNNNNNYNNNVQSTSRPHNDNQPFKVRNSFNIAPDAPSEPNFGRPNNIQISSNGARSTPATAEFNSATSRGFTTSTPVYRNLNSVSYEPEKSSFVPLRNAKQNYFMNPTTTPSTKTYLSTRPEAPLNLNTVAYNTNIGIDAQPSNYAESDEDDGQYRPPSGEDDGQYRPELYERELLSGAHSLNIAASGNRLPEDQRPRGKTQSTKATSLTSPPRPFRPSSTTTQAPFKSTTRVPETHTTTSTPLETQRIFDVFQTYTTTSRPSDLTGPAYQQFNVDNRSPIRQTTTTAPRSPEVRPQTRVTPSPTTTNPPASSRPTTRAPHQAYPSRNKDDSTYDYAYYDSDPGFSEYDNIEEFGRTKSKA